jgi:hypothetical protein
MRALILVHLEPSEEFINLYNEDLKKYRELNGLNNNLMVASPKVTDDARQTDPQSNSSRKQQTGDTTSILTLPEQIELTEYENRVKAIFISLGLQPVPIQRFEMEQQEFIKDILEEIPSGIVNREFRQVVMGGYIGRGQSSFLVTVVNPNQLHIRIKAAYLSMLQDSCMYLYNHVKKHSKKFRIIRGKHDDAKNGSSNKHDYLVLENEVQVLEPRQHQATMKGKVVESIPNALWNRERYQIVLTIVLFFVSGGLFFLTPFLAQPVSDLLILLNPLYDFQYILRAFERLSTAFVASTLIAVVNIVFIASKLMRERPIMWE